MTIIIIIIMIIIIIIVAKNLQNYDKKSLQKTRHPIKLHKN